jgi:hypothetical protein
MSTKKAGQHFWVSRDALKGHVPIVVYEASVSLHIRTENGSKFTSGAFGVHELTPEMTLK